MAKREEEIRNAYEDRLKQTESRLHEALQQMAGLEQRMQDPVASVNLCNDKEGLELKLAVSTTAVRDRMSRNEP